MEDFDFARELDKVIEQQLERLKAISKPPENKEDPLTNLEEESFELEKKRFQNEKLHQEVESLREDRKPEKIMLPKFII